MFENLVGVRAIRMVDNVRPSTISMATCADGRIIAVFNQGTLDCIYHGYFNGANDVFSGNMTPRAETWRETGYTANGRVFNINGGLYLAIRRAPAVIDGSLVNFSTIIYSSPSGNGGDWVEHGTVWSYDSDTNYYIFPASEAPTIPYVNADGRWIMMTSTQIVFWWLGIRRQDDGTSMFYSDDQGVTWTRVNNMFGELDRVRIGSEPQPYIVEYEGSLLADVRSGTSHYIMQGSLDGISWTKIVHGGGVDLSPGLMYVEDDVLYMSKLYFGSSGYGLYKINSTPAVDIPDSPWVFVYSDGDNWNTFGEGNQTIAYIGENVCILSSTGYVYKSGLVLQTMSRLVWVVPDPGGSMLFEGQRYRFVKTIAESTVTTHPNAGIPITYTYAGPTLVEDGTLLQFLASGITDPAAWGGYSAYTAETSRTVLSLANRENFVNFYYTPPQIPIVTTDEILNESLLQGFTTEFSIINIGTSPVSLCGFILSTAANPTVLSGTVIQYGPGAVGTFQARFNGKLAPDVTYYVRAFAINEVGIGYGNDLTLMIPTTVPVITNIEVTNTSEDGFSIKFSIDDLGALSANVGFVFGKTANPRIGGAGVINQAIGTVNAPQNITFDYVGDISVAEPYYLSGYGINSAGEGYGVDLTFTLPEMFFWQFVGTPRHARLTHKDEDDHPQYAKESDLASVMNDYSGADMIGVTPITGVTGGTVQEVLESIKALIGAAETGLEASFEDVDPWVITHNLQRLIDLTIWERTADAVGFGVQEFGTSLFGGAEEIHTVASPGVVTVTQQGLNETILTWGTNKSGRVVYR